MHIHLKLSAQIRPTKEYKPISFTDALSNRTFSERNHVNFYFSKKPKFDMIDKTICKNCVP